MKEGGVYEMIFHEAVDHSLAMFNARIESNPPFYIKLSRLMFRQFEAEYKEIWNRELEQIGQRNPANKPTELYLANMHNVRALIEVTQRV
jgi:hypothetical protein